MPNNNITEKKICDLCIYREAIFFYNIKSLNKLRAYCKMCDSGIHKTSHLLISKKEYLEFLNVQIIT